MNILKKIKKFKKETNLGMSILMVAGILAVLNFFSYQLFYRFDLTKNKDYSLAKTSKETVKNLDDVVNIKAYFSKELPNQYISLSQEVKDILDEYQNYSKGKISSEFIDPKDDKDLQRELKIKGVPELQFNVLEKDKYQVVNGYLGIVINYGDKTEVIPVVQDTNNLEYQITADIKKLTSKSMPVIGYLSSNGTLDVEKDIPKAYKALQGLYTVKSVDLAADKKIADDISTLVIAGPKAKFTTDQQKAIDSFLMRGGAALFLLDSIKVDGNLAATKNESDLDKLLEAYGIKLSKDLVLDISSGQASFNQGYVSFMMNYPFWPKIMKGGFDKDNVITAKLENLVLPWANSIEILKNKIDASDKISYLVKSTNQAWQNKDSLDLSPQQQFNNQDKSQFNLAVSIFGKLNSAFGKDSTEKGRLIVVGDSDFLRDSFLPSGNNLTFFQNMVDSLSLDDALINIRAKGVTDHPFAKELSDSDKALLRYLNVFGITVLVVGFGLYRYYSRRKSKFADEL